MADINVTEEIIDINVTQEVITIEAPTGAYPFPNAVFSVFGRVGAIVSAEGDYNLTQLGDVTLTSPANGQVLKYNGTTWVNSSDTDTGLTSVGLSMPSAFSVANSPLTANGTLSVTGAGTTAQYVRGDGSLATFPSLTGFVPYTGATANLDLGTFDLTTDIATLNQVKAVGSGGLSFNSNNGTQIAAMGGGGGANMTLYGGLSGTSASFASSGGSDSFAINHSSGSGIALNITKGGNGEALYINKTSGSGNAASITGGVTLLDELHLTTDLADAYIASAATWNAKQNAITLTTTGTSGAATLVGATLNIPQYQGVLTNPVTGTGTTNTLPKFTGASTIGNSNITDDGSLITLGSNSYVSTSLNPILRLNNSTNTVPTSNNIGEIQFYTNDASVAGTGIKAFINAIGGAFGSAQGAAILSFGTTGNNETNATERMRISELGGVGIGATALTQYGLRISKNITGAVTSYGISNEGVVQSDATSNGFYYNTIASTAAASFTTGNIVHYFAQQGTFGAGSTVTRQYGFFVASTLIGGTNNYGFYGDIAAAANRWNIYMNGTANNYLAGSLGIGATNLVEYSLRISKNITGGTTARGCVSDGTIQSSVTANAVGLGTGLSTAAASFTLLNLYQFYSGQGTIGAGSTVTNQYGYHADATLIGATNNYGFRGAIPAGTNRWNIYMDGTAANYMAGSLSIGTTTIPYGEKLFIQGDASASNATLTTSADSGISTLSVNIDRGLQGGVNIVADKTNQIGRIQVTNSGFWPLVFQVRGADGINERMRITNIGSVGIGATSLGQYNLRVSKNITGASNSFGIVVDGTIQSGVTNIANIFSSNPSTQAATFNLGALVHYNATLTSIGAGNTINNQFGFLAENTLVGATNNYGFYGNIASGTNRWNLYMNGTANNYLAGGLGIGSTSVGNGINLNMAKTMTGATTQWNIYNQSQVQSDVTVYAAYYRTNAATQAATFTLTDLAHYATNQGTFGAGSTVTNQYGFVASGTMLNATNNYGFYGGISSGTNRWNLYMAGTAANYMAGTLSIGTTSTSYALTVQGAIYANNDGSSVGLYVNSNGAIRGIGDLYIDTAAASNKDLIFRPNVNERVRIKSTGQMRFVPLASDPSGAQAGDVYYNSTTNKLKVYNGTAWETITSL
jgi:hypothetical protein